MTGSNGRLLLVIGGVGTVITALSVTDTTDSSKRLGGAVGAVIAAAVAATIVTLVRGRLHPLNQPPRTASKLLSIAGSLTGVAVAMAIPRSSLDPLVLGAITGGLLALFYWSMVLSSRTPATGTDGGSP